VKTEVIKRLEEEDFGLTGHCFPVLVDGLVYSFDALGDVEGRIFLLGDVDGRRVVDPQSVCVIAPCHGAEVRDMIL